MAAEPPLSDALSPGVAKTIAAYLYQEYQNDAAVGAFVNAENQMSQYYLDWFNGINLPVYTSPTIGGALLDWVGAGLYGMFRPTIHTALVSNITGPIGTVLLGAPPPFAMVKRTGPTTFFATTDDVYKRILTWHFYKGDGKVFNVRWLKRRVMRFLIGTNGTAPRIDFTPQIRVFMAGGTATIIILLTTISVTASNILGTRTFGTGPPLGSDTTVITALQPFAMAVVFKAAVDSGVLELPFQYQWTVLIIGST